MKGTENNALYIHVNISGTFYSESYYKSVSLCNSEGAHASCFLSPLIPVRGNNQTQADQPFSIIYRPSPSARGCSARLLLLPRPRHLTASPAHLIGLLMNLKKKEGDGTWRFDQNSIQGLEIFPRVFSLCHSHWSMVWPCTLCIHILQVGCAVL